MFNVFAALDLTSLSTTSLVLQTTLLVTVVTVLFKVLAFLRNMRSNIALFKDIPGPSECSFIRGSFKNFPTDPHERMMKFVEWTNTYSNEKGYFRLFGNFYRPIISACHPLSVKTILKTAEPKPINLSSGYRMLKPWLGDGLLIAGGAKWARNRRLLTPAFHFDILKPYIDVYNSSADVLVNKLDKCAQKGEKFELFTQICMCTLDIILRCAFSYDIDVQGKGDDHPYVSAVRDISLTVSFRARESHPYVAAVRELAITLSMRTRNPYMLLDWVFYLTPTGRKFRRDCDYVHSVAEDIMAKRQATLGKLGNQKDRKYLDFLDILLTARDENGVGLSPIDIRNEVDTFLFEGHDTTASAISWIMYSLAEHPEYQRKCQNEVDAILKDRETDDLEWSDLQNMDYLTMCIKEGMRLHTPVSIVARETTKEMTIGDKTFPKNTGVQINIWALHHNASVWGDNHWEFDPDRFTKENIAKMDPYQFVPFSGGPRNCIGQHFAMNEEKVVIAKLLYNFTFKLDPGHVVRKRLAAVMRAENGIMMYVERRRH